MGAIWTLKQAALSGRGRPRLDALDLSIEAGITAVMGPSGAGKTSLLNLLVGFEAPDQGAVSGPPQPIAWSPQDGGLWPHLSVREHIAAVTTRDVAEFLQPLRLMDHLNARPHKLSQGERSRLSIARALATGRDLLVLDEPLVNVDAASEVEGWAFILETVRRRKGSLVYSTHVPEKVLGIAASVVCLDAGRLSYHGSVEELYYYPENPSLAEVLGPCNWFEPGDTLPGIDARLLRPEQLLLIPDVEGSFEVLEVIFRGSLEEVLLRDCSSQKSRHLLHRPPCNRLKKGDRLRVECVNGS
ncbi:MAG: iron(III) transport system ATP-binding protein [Kiritimatiellia bacterium]|jgi:iron(III) transport system ATP-binding protein